VVTLVWIAGKLYPENKNEPLDARYRMQKIIIASCPKNKNK